jgi:hypothetical protein
MFSLMAIDFFARIIRKSRWSFAYHIAVHEEFQRLWLFVASRTFSSYIYSNVLKVFDRIIQCFTTAPTTYLMALRLTGIHFLLLGVAVFFLAVSGYLLYCDFAMQYEVSWSVYKTSQTSQVIWASVSVMLVGAMTLIAAVICAPKGESDSSSPPPRQRFSLLQ